MILVADNLYEYGGPVLSDLPGYAVGREMNETDIRRIRGSFFNTISCAEPAHDETECLLIERPGFPLVTLNKVFEQVSQVLGNTSSI